MFAGTMFGKNDSTPFVMPPAPTTMAVPPVLNVAFTCGQGCCGEGVLLPEPIAAVVRSYVASMTTAPMLKDVVWIGVRLIAPEAL